MRPTGRHYDFDPVHAFVIAQDYGQVRRRRTGREFQPGSTVPRNNWEDDTGPLWTVTDTVELLVERAKLHPHPRYAMTFTSVRQWAYTYLTAPAADYIATLLGVQPTRLWPEWADELVPA